MSHGFRLSALALSVSLLASCAVGPDYEPVMPEAPAQSDFVNAGDDSLFAEGTISPDWWRLYEEEALNEIVMEALQANTDLRAAAANLSRAEAVLRESRTARLPMTDIEATERYSRQNFFFGDDPLVVQNHVYNADLRISYQIDLFGRVRRAIEATRANAEAVRAAYHAAQITVAAETVRAFAEACALGYQLEVANNSLSLQTESYQLTNRLRDAGRGTAFEVASASTLVAQTRAMLPSLRAQHSATLYRLAVLMGREPSAYPEAAAGCVQPLQMSQAIPVGDGADLLRRRPDVKQAERELAAATARVGLAIAEFYPSVSFGGSIGSAALSASDLFQSSTQTWSYGPMISWSFPNVVATQARKRQAQADMDAALARFDGAWLNALRETESALAAYASELERRASLSEAQQQSAEAARLARARFDAGQLSFFDVLQSELMLTDVEMTLAQSEARVAALQVDLFLALGGGWRATDVAE